MLIFVFSLVCFLGVFFGGFWYDDCAALRSADVTSVPLALSVGVAAV